MKRPTIPKSKPQTRTDKLNAIIAERKLSAWQVAELLGVKLNTVQVWTCKNDTQIPQAKLTLLDILTRNAV